MIEKTHPKKEALQRLCEQYLGVEIVQQNELLFIQVNNESAEAMIALQGAQVIHYKAHNKEVPLLFLSDDCRYKQGSPLRGGIPICWPWFGDLEKNRSAITNQVPIECQASAPAHGFVRNQDWQLSGISCPSVNETHVTLTLVVDGQDPLWPFRTQLFLQVHIGETLSLSLETTNLSDRPMAFTQALHSYFTVSHIDAVSIDGFDKVDYIDALDGWEVKTQEGPIKIKEEVDRVYQSAPSPIKLQTGEGVVNIESENSQSTIVWNPWVEKSARLSQFKDDDYQNMVCIETANAVDDIITLESQQSYTLSVTISD